MPGSRPSSVLGKLLFILCPVCVWIWDAHVLQAIQRQKGSEARIESSRTSESSPSSASHENKKPGRLFRVDDVVSLRKLQSVQISPDGSQIAFVDEFQEALEIGGLGLHLGYDGLSDILRMPLTSVGVAQVPVRPVLRLGPSSLLTQ